MILAIISLVFSLLISLLILVVKEAKKCKKELENVDERTYFSTTRSYPYITAAEFNDLYDEIDASYIPTERYT